MASAPGRKSSISGRSPDQSPSYFPPEPSLTKLYGGTRRTEHYDHRGDGDGGFGEHERGHGAAPLVSRSCREINLRVVADAVSLLAPGRAGWPRNSRADDRGRRVEPGDISGQIPNWVERGRRGPQES